jgi:poly-beta-hydroxyalkanoate depolymerase
MKTTKIDAGTVYSNHDERLGDPGKYMGREIIAQIAILGDNGEDWDIEEVPQTAAALGRRGGAAKTQAQADAARENGKKGGRPRKVKPQ